jgi:hypothetical protein
MQKKTDFLYPKLQSGSHGSTSTPDYQKYHKLGTIVGAGAASKILPGAGAALK